MAGMPPPVRGKTAAGRAWMRLCARVGAAITRATDVLARAEPLYTVAGPLFERELRVSARRARTYVLRFVYLAVLGAFVGMVWLSAVTVASLTTSPVYYAYGMADAGKYIISMIVWFQFVLLPLIAIVVLSNSISEEIHQRTLGVMMTTPITSVQIVAGKLLGKMLQLLLLLAVSAPMLLLTQALGGVSWGFVASALGLTLTTTLLAGSLSMYFSITSRRSPILVILKASAAMLGVFLIVPWAVAELRAYATPPAWADLVLTHMNPYLILGLLTADLYTPGLGGGVTLAWWLHALILGGASGLLFGVCVFRVRRAAMRQLVGDPGGWLAGRRWRAGRPGRIRRVRGSPVVWRELRASVFASRALNAAGWVAALAVLGATYLIFLRDLDDGDVQVVYGIVLMIFGGLGTAVITATGIAKEKETGTWPLLLVTPLANGQIVAGKAIALLRRALSAWVPLALHCLLFVSVGYLHPVAPFQIAIIAAGVTAVLMGSGLLFSTWVRRGTWAILLNVGFAVLLWGVSAVIFSMVITIVHIMVALLWGSTPFTTGPPRLLIVYFAAHPLFEVGIVMEATGGVFKAAPTLWQLRYDWMDVKMGAMASTAVLVTVALVNSALGLLMARWATRGLRRKPF